MAIENAMKFLEQASTDEAPRQPATEKEAAEGMAFASLKSRKRPSSDAAGQGPARQYKGGWK